MIIINFMIPIKAIRVNENPFLYEILKMTDLYQNELDYEIRDEVEHRFTNELSTTKLKIFPVYEANVLIGFIFEDANGNYSIGAYYADVLNSIIDVNEAFELVFHEGQVFVQQYSIIHEIVELTSSRVLSNSTNMITRDYGNEITAVPYKGMNTGLDCWAACMASIIQFKGTNISTAAVVSQTGNNNMASIQNVSNYLSNLYNINHNLYPYPLSFNEAMSSVGNAHPIIAACNRLGTGTGHMVIIKGVYYLTSGNNDAMYKLMDPYSSSTVNVVTMTNSNLSFVSYGGHTYQWASSIVVS